MFDEVLCSPAGISSAWLLLWKSWQDLQVRKVQQLFCLLVQNKHGVYAVMQPSVCFLFIPSLYRKLETLHRHNKMVKSTHSILHWLMAPLFLHGVCSREQYVQLSCMYVRCDALSAAVIFPRLLPLYSCSIFYMVAVWAAELLTLCEAWWVVINIGKPDGYSGGPR